MALVNAKELLEHARANHYALGAFEIINLDFLRAIIDAAEQARSSVILNLRAAHADEQDLELLAPVVVRAARRSRVPVVVHMDLCRSLNSVQTAIRLGCNSVMYDNISGYPAENTEATQKVVELAHSCGIPVEGGLGLLSADKDTSSNAEQLRDYVEHSGIDFLSLTIDGVPEQAGNQAALDEDRLEWFSKSKNKPLVIHGAQSLNERQTRTLIDRGAAKINYDIDALNRQIKDKLPEKDADEFKMNARLRESISALAQNIFNQCRSTARAEEAIAQCGPWHNVEHVIVYNTSETDPAAILNMMVTGKQQLSSIPGVLDVKIGRTTEAKGKYRYCWLIRFAHENVIESYKNHPIHVAYADTYFRPIAADRVSNNYEIFDDLQVGASLQL